MVPLHWYIRFGYSVKKNSFKGLDIDCIQYSNIIRITYYSYSYSGTILNPNIIRIRIRPNICARILFVFVFAHSEKNEYYSYSVKILIPNIIRIRIRSKKQYSLTSALNLSSWQIFKCRKPSKRQLFKTASGGTLVLK